MLKKIVGIGRRLKEKVHQHLSHSSPEDLLKPQATMVAEPWFIDAVEHSPDGITTVRGWALQDQKVSNKSQGRRFRVNGEPPLEICYPQPRPDVQKVFWQRRGAELCGFVLKARTNFPNGLMEVRCSSSMSTKISSGRECWFLPNADLQQNLPDPDRRYRVIGNRDPDGFLMLGATDAMRIVSAFENATGRRFDRLGAVLDWGCGCGRVARHLTSRIGQSFFGCDIDEENVSWCANNLPGSYRSSRLEPPLPFSAETFDLIYGISVFTHLSAPWELKWLEELHRVLKPGGVILMTVHGQTAINFAALQPAIYKELVEKVQIEGLVVTSPNDQLNGFVEHPEEYVNTFHSEGHIFKIWGNYLKNIKIIPGYVFTHDLVIATKR